MRVRRKAITLVAVALVVALVVSDAARANTVGKAASNFTLQTHDGKELTLSRLKGKRGVVLVFFATWCPPCMAEVPHVKKFVESSRNMDVLVYGINIRQPKRVVQRFVRDRAVNYVSCSTATLTSRRRTVSLGSRPSSGLTPRVWCGTALIRYPAKRRR